MAKRSALAAVGHLTIDGADIESEYNAQSDKLIRLAYWADIAQKELAVSNAPIRKTAHISVGLHENMISESIDEIRNAKLYYGTPVMFKAVGARSFYVEVDGKCSIDVEVGDTYLKHYDVENETNSFISVKDIIDNEDGLEVRLFLFGGYPYRYRNEALYLAPYENAASVADYSEYITFESKVHDLYRVHPHDVKFIGNGGSEGNYYFEGGKLYLGNTSEGVWNVSYYAMPSDITEETPDDYEFEVPKEAHMAIVMKMAYGICVDMGFTTSSFAVFKQEHAQLFNMIEPHDRYRYTKIQNVY